MKEMFNTVLKKQNNDGTWNNERRVPGLIQEKKGKSRWITYNALKFLVKISEKESV